MLLTLCKKKKLRVQAIRNSLIGSPPGICPERIRYYTQAYQQFQSDPPILKRAKALRNYLYNKTITLRDDDLIPGYQSSHSRWAPIFPEYSWRWIYDELDSFNKRKYDPFVITNETKEELRSHLSWWEGKSLNERILSRQPEYIMDATRMGVISWKGQATSGEGHIVVDYKMALELGIEKIRERAAFLKKQLPLYEPGSLSKRDFYESVEIVCDGVLIFTKRLAQFTEEQASKTADPERRRELLDIAKDCWTVFSEPATTFRQALFIVWFVHLILQMESSGHSISLGRFDQYMYPYYDKDLAEGRITREEALELLEHFYLKIFSVIKLRTEKHSRTQTGYPTYQNLCVGGQTVDGVDATNPLSSLCLSALAEVRLSEPNFYIRLHKDTPEEFLLDALKVVRTGIGMPAFVNDAVIIPSLEGQGVSHQDAMDYSTMGCAEVLVPGKWGFRANGKSKLNMLKVMELALNNGRDPATGIQLKKCQENIAELTTFDELIAAWREQLTYYTQTHVIADNINDQALEEMVPNAFCSMFVHDCLERGKHLNEGGAIYDSTSGCLVGIPNVGNVLAALKKTVYEEKTLTLQEIKFALAENFESKRGKEIHQILLNKVPKYGEDDNYVDELTAIALNDYCDVIDNYKNMRFGRGPIGGKYFTSTNTVSANITAGDYVGATPDGRKMQEPTADGISPAQGTGKLGPTAIFHSVSKLPTVRITGGQLLNMRITPSSLATDEGIKKLSALLRTFFEMDGWHVQFNTISTEILKDAILHPENYPDLIVRVAGYSALFVALDPVLQQDIIARMEHNF